jgi:molybdenum cofactor synthesis domain-containing protein
VQCAVILVGDELLSGHTRDANGYFLAQRLAALGHRLRRVSVVPDERNAIVGEIDAVLPTVDVTFLAGGLGPTHDDRTTECVAERFHRRLVLDEASWARLSARYDARGTYAPEAIEAAKKMVRVPEGCEVLENGAGAAPGYVLREGDHALVVMPGVPAELQAIFEDAVVGKVLPRSAPTGLVEVDIEMAEAVFAQRLAGVATRFADVEIGSYPHYGERRVTLRFKGDPARAQAALDAFLAAVPEARPTLRASG